MTAPATEIKPVGERPVLRGIVKNADDSFSDVLALWPAKKAGMFTGYAKIGGAEQRVIAFSNKVAETGARFLNVVKHTAQGEEHGPKIGNGNAINSHKDNSLCHFDTVAFNFGDETIYARTTASASDAVRDQLGFNSAAVQREKYVQDDAARPDAPRS